jgi:hypothetical protein
VANESSLWLAGASAFHELLFRSLDPDPWGWLQVGWLWLWLWLCPLAWHIFLYSRVCRCVGRGFL